MLIWREFREAEPELSKQGASILYQFGVGLGFLATVRADGGPRVHPMCPLISEDGLYAFIIPSPKQRDLRRDARFSLHSFPMPDNEDAFYIAGRAVEATDDAVRGRLAVQFVEERSAIGVSAPAEHDALFELLVESVMLTRTTGHGDPSPTHQVWRAP
jgi:hypothetical protein